MQRFLLASFLLAIACGDDDATPDLDAGTASTDAGPNTDAGGADEDAGSNEEDAGSEDTDGGAACTQLSVDRWLSGDVDDVSSQYEAMLTPSGPPNTLRVLFERYAIGPDEGTFTLGEGMDDNFGNCAHCLYAPITAERVYFADAGTLELRSDPYSLRLDARVTGLRLIEVEVDPITRESTPIDGGGCVEIADFEVDEVFTPEGWACDDALYGDGSECHCECGAIDPDCSSDCFPGGPDCEENPVVDCSVDDVCAFNPLTSTTQCTATCDWREGTACGEGVCVYSFGVGDYDPCLPMDDERVDAAVFGEECAAGGLVRACNVVDGFARGYCLEGEERTCVPLCESAEDCTGDTCTPWFYGDEWGYCGELPSDG